MALYESEKPLNSTEISEIISSKTSGKIYKVSAALIVLSPLTFNYQCSLNSQNYFLLFFLELE